MSPQITAFRSRPGIAGYSRKAEGATLPTLGHLFKEQTFTWIDDSSDIEAISSISDLADLRKFNQLLRKTE